MADDALEPNCFGIKVETGDGVEDLVLLLFQLVLKGFVTHLTGLQDHKGFNTVDHLHDLVPEPVVLVQLQILEELRLKLNKFKDLLLHTVNNQLVHLEL